MSKSSITTEKRLPPIHPGRILLEDLKDEQISINGLAQAIRVPANRISLIVNEKRGITADTAARLGRYFGTSAQYWLNIQNRFDLDSLDHAALFFLSNQVIWLLRARSLRGVAALYRSRSAEDMPEFIQCLNSSSIPTS
jgi:antitoxin HigA-1